MGVEVIVDQGSRTNADESVWREAEKLVVAELVKIGCEGAWIMKPTVRDRPKPDAVYWKGVIPLEGGRSGISCVVRAFNDGKTSWKYTLIPPSCYSAQEVFDRLKTPVVSAPPPGAVTKSQVDPKPVVGHIYSAEVKVLKSFGVDIMVKGKGWVVPGFIPLQELTDEYDPSLLEKYKNDRNITVMCMENGKVGKYSKKAADIHLSVNKGKYAGIPDSKGLLNLDGYSDSYERMHQLLAWLAELQVDYYDDRNSLCKEITKEEVLDWLEVKLKQQTRARLVSAKALSNLLALMATTDYEWLEIRTEGPLTWYKLTSFGMGEAMTVATPVVKEPLPIVEEKKPEEHKPIPLPDVKPDPLDGYPERIKNCMRMCIKGGLSEAVSEAAMLLVNELDHLGSEEEKDKQTSIVIRLLIRTCSPKFVTKLYEALNATGVPMKTVSENLGQLERCLNRLDDNINDCRKAAAKMSIATDKVCYGLLNLRSTVLELEEPMERVAVLNEVKIIDVGAGK